MDEIGWNASSGQFASLHLVDYWCWITVSGSAHAMHRERIPQLSIFFLHGNEKITSRKGLIALVGFRLTDG
jgi:hypothetical protein